MFLFSAIPFNSYLFETLQKKEEVLENDFAIHPFIRSFISYVVSLRRHVDGISFGEAMEKVVQLCIISYENIVFDKSQILTNDIQ